MEICWEASIVSILGRTSRKTNSFHRNLMEKVSLSTFSKQFLFPSAKKESLTWQREEENCYKEQLASSGQQQEREIGDFRLVFGQVPRAESSDIYGSSSTQVGTEMAGKVFKHYLLKS